MRAVVALVALALGCTPSAEGVCEQVTRAVERSWPSDPKDPGARDRMIATCVTKWSQRKKDDPTAFKCYADCIDKAKHALELGACEKKCYPNMQVADETEKLEGVIAFPDAGTPIDASETKPGASTTASETKPEASATGSTSANASAKK